MFKKTRLVGISALMIASILITATAATYTNSRSTAEQMEQSRIWAQIDTAPAPQNDEILIEGKNVTVYKDETNRIAERYAAGDVDNGEELAISYILRREVLYNAGIDNNFTATDAEVQAVIQQNEEMAKNAIGREFFDEYLETAGITEHEYWIGQSDKFKKEIVIEKYLSDIRERNNISPEEWNAFEDNWVKSLIEAEEIS
ncbi:hypothetical protein NE562_05750 [Butyricicoccus faecihominis]|uniref:hypothetical protein n=1 Tax=Butyricicoccus faecihominis TaxID=1712515 RepID=UPI0024790688|nr:hypothetical protein [Butyricicoccus faecihominis]MCQ5129157.1 hypothetical protein [Butyricicoccus faecihominis]